MPNRDIARKIVSSYINCCSFLGFEEALIELAAVEDSDEKLLEHIELMVDILEKAREEIKNGDSK